MRRRAIFVSLLAILVVSPLASVACSIDEARFASYFAKQLRGTVKFFAINDPVKRLAYMGPAARAALPALRDLANRGRGPTRHLALWAIARIAPEDPSTRAAVNEAADKSGSRNFYERLTAAAFLARTGDAVSSSTVNSFLPPLYEELRKIEERNGSVYKRAMIAWVLYEIGTPETIPRAERITRSFLDDPFPETSFMTGIDAFEVIGPHAVLAVPMLTDIVLGEYDVIAWLYRDDAARTLMIVGGEDAEQTVARYLDEIRADLFEKPSVVDTVLDILLGLSEDRLLIGTLDDLTQLLPYSYCAQPEVETILQAEGRGPESYLSAAAFLIESGSTLTELIRRRLLGIQSRAPNPELRDRAQRLLDRL